MRSTSTPASAKSWPAYLFLLGLVALFCGLGADVLHQVSRGRFAAESTYYSAAAALAHGSDPYTLIPLVYPYVYPPLFACCFRPLALLPEPMACRVMAMLDGGFILAALLLSSRTMLRRFHVDGTWKTVVPVALVAGLIAVVPIHKEWRGLETNSLVLLSFALSFYWLDKRPVLAGLALAFAINIKYLPIIAVPYFLLRRRWLAALATLGWTIALALLPAIFLGWSTNLHYLHEAVTGLSHLTSSPGDGGARVNTAGDLSSISLTSVLSRAAQAAGWSRHVELAMVGAVAAAWIGPILLVYRVQKLPVLLWPVGASQQTSPYSEMRAVEWAALIAFALAFSPNTQDRNLVLAVIPATLAAVLLCTRAAPRRRIVAAIVCVVMLVALALPVAIMGKPFTIAWVSAGGACWTLLATSAALAYVGLARSGMDPLP